MITDLTFITNEKNQNLKDRLKILAGDSKFFDCLVGYFYTTGFYTIYKSLDKIEKIRILIGISTNKQVADLLDLSEKQQEFQFSHAEVKEEVEVLVEKEFENSEDNHHIEEGVAKFIELVKSKK